MIFTYSHRGTTYNVELERLPDGMYRGTLNERVYTFAAEAIEGGWSLAFPESGARAMTHVVVDGDSRAVSLNGETYTLIRETQRTGRRSAAPGAHGGAVSTQMPGQVREILVTEGDLVERGQTLVIVEAMKMEVRVTSPVDGKVKRLLVGMGDVVSRGQVLLEIG
jgi:biotin carboxyl carrier protein